MTNETILVAVSSSILPRPMRKCRKTKQNVKFFGFSFCAIIVIYLSNVIRENREYFYRIAR